MRAVLCCESLRPNTKASPVRNEQLELPFRQHVDRQVYITEWILFETNSSHGVHTTSEKRMASKTSLLRNNHYAETRKPYSE